MYQYANIRAAAKRLDTDFLIRITSSSDFAFFPTIFPNAKYQIENLSSSGHFVEENHQYTNHIVERDNTRAFKTEIYNACDDTLFDGYFQNHQYWIEIDDLIREWFQPTIAKEDEAFFEELHMKYADYVIIGYRGTDFERITDYQTSADYYRRAQQYFNGAKFAVITDDIPSASKKIQAHAFIQVDRPEQTCIAFKLLTKANWIIIPNWSSFFWWGAWLSKAKLILAPETDSNYKNNRFVYV